MSEAKITRRQLLRSLGTLGASALVACSSAGTLDNARPSPESKPAPTRLSSPGGAKSEPTKVSTSGEKLIHSALPAIKAAELPNVIDGKKNLMEYVHRLPETSIKQSLTKRVIEKHFQSQPQKLSFGTTDVLMHGAEVDVRYFAGTGIFAYFDARYNMDKQPPLHTTRETRIAVPMVGLVFEHDKEAIPKEWVLPDGTATYPIRVNQNTDIREGIRPTIVLKLPHPSFTGNSKEYWAVLERFYYVKEACNFLLFDLWLEKVFAKMQEMQLPTTVETPTRRVEIVTSLLDYIASKKGRYVAAFDLAAYILALKAFEKSPDRAFLAQEPVLSKSLPHVVNLSLGTSDDKLLFDSLWHAATNPEVHKLVHNGEITAFP